MYSRTSALDIYLYTVSFSVCHLADMMIVAQHNARLAEFVAGGRSYGSCREETDGTLRRSQTQSTPRARSPHRPRAPAPHTTMSELCPVYAPFFGAMVSPASARAWWVLVVYCVLNASTCRAAPVRLSSRVSSSPPVCTKSTETDASFVRVGQALARGKQGRWGC